MNTQTNPWIGFWRGIAYVVIGSIASYLSVSVHLTGIVPPAAAVLIAGLAGFIDHWIESQGQGALFGAIKK